MTGQASQQIPGPGYGPLEGAVETHGTQAIGPAGRPAVCETCAWWHRLLGGGAGICHEKWRGLKWNDAVPITTAGETCEKYELRAAGERADGRKE